MQLYNTMTRKKELFTPVTAGRAGLYACGITAYDYCHIGHARSAVVFDVLVRYLEKLGLEVTFVRNFTDVDDKIINRANKEAVSEKEIAARFIAAFHEDMDRLNVRRATVEPRATEYIPEMIAICEKLIAGGHAYAVPSGDVYFRVRSFAGYGKLSGRDVDDMRAGARVAPGEEKEDPLDFALWKSAKAGEPSWDSPWGPGRPGWHIECSAMSEKQLPLPLDIHGGGQDLIFPHHENELAQTEAATGKEFARFWVHNGFVQIDSEKMSKSLNNFKTIRDILDLYPAEALRFFLLARHYRSPVDFTAGAMDEAEKNLKRLYETLSALKAELAGREAKGGKASEDLAQSFADARRNFEDSLADDLNSAAAIGELNNLAHLVNRVLDDKSQRKNAGVRELLAEARELFAEAAAVLGFLLLEPELFLEELKNCRIKRRNIDLGQVETMLRQRIEARQNKDFAASDRLRDELAALGVEVRDTPGGQQWEVL
ncbi:cysteine--tRNA ligase [Desulfovibrio sp. OttesenSCG-928-G11]|nr:cysteine--tRNA ligase [Desulfovibrio sp. OttesenSCG-928-G11]